MPSLVGWARTLDELRARATDLHAEATLACGDWTDAAGASATAMDAEPLREPAVVLHMRALAGSGRAAEALRAAHAYRRRLSDETGLDPSPALAALEHTIAASDAPAPTPAAEPTRPTPSHPGPRLFGRDAEVAGVARLLDSERVVTLVGPGGVGKTTIALEAARRDRGGREVTIVKLAAVTAAALITALGLRTGTRDHLAIADMLATRPWLLVLDDCRTSSERRPQSRVRTLVQCAGAHSPRHQP